MDAKNFAHVLFNVSGTSGWGDGSLDEIQRPLGLQIIRLEAVLLGDAVRHRRPHLPHLLHHRHPRRQLQLPVEPHRPAGVLRRQIRRIEVDRPLRDGRVPGDVVGTHPHRPVGLVESDQGLGPQHAVGGGVDRPRHPPFRFRGRRDEREGEGSGGGVVGPVDRGGVAREVAAGGVEAVRGEGHGRAPAGGRGITNGRKEEECEAEPQSRPLQNPTFPRHRVSRPR